MDRFLLIILCCCFFSIIQAQTSQNVAPTPGNSEDTILPKAFIIGEYEKQFETLNIEHSTMLLAVCDNDMNLAFSKWLSMLKEMEAYADVIGYDLKSLKLWLNVFWEKEGKIKHIAYYPKPGSRNVNLEELSAFFSSFMNHYTFPLVAEVDYSHYGSASFPTF
ncbi:MAG: hypothetical protein AAGG75_24835 [Bacteroidota bacterium]